METAERKKIDAVLDKVVRHYTELGDALEALNALLNAQPTKGQEVKQLFDTWAEAWKNRHRDRYVFNNNRAVAASFSRLLKEFDGGEIARRMVKYIASNDPFIAREKHPLGLFVSSFNRWGDVGDLFAPPVGCRHSPPCESDAVHTQRYQKELRQPEPPL